jgi:hypothetical protein
MIFIRLKFVFELYELIYSFLVLPDFLKSFLNLLSRMILLDYSLMIVLFIVKIHKPSFDVFLSSSFIAFQLIVDIQSFFDPNSC